jgi:hypothetical protein
MVSIYLLLENVSLLTLMPDVASRLWDNWQKRNYDQRLRNGQNFVVYVAILILEQVGQEDNSMHFVTSTGIFGTSSRATLTT